MKKIQSAVIAICIIFFATMSHAQEMRLFNAKAGIGHISSKSDGNFYYDQTTAAHSFNIGASASYRMFELELAYIKSIAVLGRKHYRNWVSFDDLPRVGIRNNQFDSFKSIQATLNLRLNMAGFKFKIGGGFGYNIIRPLRFTTYDHELNVSNNEPQSYTPIQPILKFSNNIGPYEFTISRLFQFVDATEYGPPRKTPFFNVSISRYLFSEVKKETFIYVRPTKDRILTITPGWQLFYPLGGGLASGATLFIDVSFRIKKKWEISLSLHPEVNAFGVDKTEEDFIIDEDGYPAAVNKSRIEDVEGSYSLLFSRVKKISDDYSWLYGIGPALTLVDRYRDSDQKIPGLIASTALYTPGMFYRFELNVPLKNIPPQINFSFGIPISVIYKSSKKKEPIDLDNINI